VANENFVSRPGTISDPLSMMSDVVARVQDKASELGQRASEFGQNAVAAIDARRGTAASGLSSAADKISATADYVREKKVRDMVADVGACIKAYPRQALLGAAVVGFFAGRMLRRD
jgi:ElaB/YqjD/DUF883 family membrane-anchored ribosome-binding protein